MILTICHLCISAVAAHHSALGDRHIDMPLLFSSCVHCRMRLVACDCKPTRVRTNLFLVFLIARPPGCAPAQARSGRPHPLAR